MAKRKTLAMLVTVSVPANQSASWARREVRNLINHGVGWTTNAGDTDGVKARAVKGFRA